MKTCSYRHATPRSPDEGLFCLTEPLPRYGLNECGNCGLCYPKLSIHVADRCSPVHYNDQHEYRCLNNFRILLNCPAVCCFSY